MSRRAACANIARTCSSPLKNGSRSGLYIYIYVYILHIIYYILYNMSFKTWPSSPKEAKESETLAASSQISGFLGARSKAAST